MKIPIFFLFFLISKSISLLIPGIGNIIGQTNEYFDSYLKVPYAYPPLGSLRFKSPKSPYIWERTYNSKEYPSICPQNDSPDSDYIWYPNRTISEDCLYLSIWAPKKIDPNGNSVLVFIHGGSFKEGGASQWILNGEHMAKNESIIFVLVQYRLGILGFLGIDELKQESDEKITGNYGILDQISALKWIKNNIKAFGGNPNKITLAGESAGGSSVSLHLIMNQSKGLFNQAVIFSTATFIELFNEEKLFNQSKSSLKNICNNKTSENILNCIRNISVKDILTLPFKDSNPVIDGVYIKEHTYKSFKNWENINNVNSILIGNVKNEGTMFLPQNIIPLNQYKNTIFEYCNWNISNQTIEKIQNKYICNENNCFNQLAEIVGDSWFICPAILISKSISKTNKNKIYSYVFSQITQSLKNIFPLYKVSHGSEIPYFFYNVNYEFFNFTYEEKKLAKVMSHNLAEFVKEKNYDFILFNKKNEFARINFTVTNDDKYYDIVKNWKNNICDKVWLETYENAYDYREKKEVYEEKLEITTKLLDRLDREFDFPSTKSRDFLYLMDKTSKAFQIYELCSNEVCFELELLNLSMMGRFFKRIIQGFHKQINIAQKFLFEQMKYNLLISSETRKSINESQIDKMTMSIVGENEQQRNSLVENFEKINNLTKLQMEKKNEQGDTGSQKKTDLQIKMEENNLLLRNQIQMINNTNNQLVKQNQDLIIAMTKKESERKALEEELIKTIKSNINSQNTKFNENISNKTKGKNSIIENNQKNEMSVDDYLLNVINKSKEKDKQLKEKEEAKEKENIYSSIKKQNDDHIINEEDKNDEIAFAELKLMLEKKDKTFSKVKESGAGKELKILNRAIAIQKKNFNRKDDLETVPNFEDLNSPLSPEPNEELKHRISIKKLSPPQKKEKPLITSPILKKPEMLTKSTQPDVAIFDIGIIESLTFRVQQQKITIGELTRSLESQNKDLLRQELEKSDIRLGLEAERRKVFELSSKIANFDYDMSKLKENLRSEQKLRAEMEEKCVKKMRKNALLKEQLNILKAPTQKSKDENDEKNNLRLTVLEFKRENEKLREEIIALKLDNEQNNCYLLSIKEENNVLLTCNTDLKSDLKSLETVYSKEKLQILEKYNILKNIIEENDNTKEIFTQKIDEGVLKNDLSLVFQQGDQIRENLAKNRQKEGEMFELLDRKKADFDEQTKIAKNKIKEKKNSFINKKDIDKEKEKEKVKIKENKKDEQTLDNSNLNMDKLKKNKNEIQNKSKKEEISKKPDEKIIKQTLDPKKNKINEKSISQFQSKTSEKQIKAVEKITKLTEKQSKPLEKPEKIQKITQIQETKKPQSEQREQKSKLKEKIIIKSEQSTQTNSLVLSDIAIQTDKRKKSIHKKTDSTQNEFSISEFKEEKTENKTINAQLKQQKNKTLSAEKIRTKKIEKNELNNSHSELIENKIIELKEIKSENEAEKKNKTEKLKKIKESFLPEIKVLKATKDIIKNHSAPPPLNVKLEKINKDIQTNLIENLEIAIQTEELNPNLIDIEKNNTKKEELSLNDNKIEELLLKNALIEELSIKNSLFISENNEKTLKISDLEKIIEDFKHKSINTFEKSIQVEIIDRNQIKTSSRKEKKRSSIDFKCFFDIPDPIPNSNSNKYTFESVKSNDKTLSNLNFSKYREIFIDKTPSHHEIEEDKIISMYSFLKKLVEKQGIQLFLSLAEPVSSMFKRVLANKRDNEEVNVKMPDLIEFKESVKNLQNEHEKCGPVCEHLKRFYEKLGWNELKMGRRIFKIHKRNISRVKL